MTNRRALVTGSTKGIGSAVADALAAEGFDLVLSARSRDDLTLQSQDLAARHGTSVATVPADLSRREDVERLASEAVAAFDGLDLLVNNAGISFPEPVVDLDADHWDATLAVNLTAPCLLASRVGGDMARRGSGRIVNIASAAGLRALRDHYAYSVSKAGLVMATRMQALELGAHGVRSNVLCPTVVMTEMGQRVWGEDEKAAPMLQRIPVGHFAQPADVAAAVVYLASEAAEMLNGVELPVDGGYLVS
jgi:NAD(P)-dependent dehydrogenase (short-subunit alcohol dehydrogenase family)